jgi:hypothetical protein
VEKLINTRSVSAKADLERQIEGLSAERRACHRRLADIQINQGVVLAATKRGCGG